MFGFYIDLTGDGLSTEERELRDKFASDAAMAYLTTEQGLHTDEKELAKQAYKFADAMLQARKVLAK